MKSPHVRDSLRIVIPARELYDDRIGEFVYTQETQLTLVHSLVSISAWESKYHRAFLSDKYEKTPEMIRDYIKCMTVGSEPDPMVYNYLTNDNYKMVEEYIGNPMTASHLPDDPNAQGGRTESMTAELIYYWMISLNIWLEAEKWHINRLLTLIRVTERKNRVAQGKGPNSASMARSNSAKNRARRHH